MEMEENFPVGMKVLAVDDDSTYLASLASLLRQCKYHVVTANTAMEALQILGENKDDEFALIISVIDHMPEMDGFELLQQVDDIPVVLMSSAIDDNKEVIMKGMSHGACHYLSKPVPIEELKNIWQHVFRRKLESTVRRQDERRKKDPNPEPSTQKKPPRFVWSQERHRKFVEAIDQLGMENAVPKKILELMNDKDIKRQHVASHLQKYKEQIKKPAGGHSTSGQLKKMDLSPSAAAAADPGINGDTQMSTGAHLVSYGQLVSGTHNRQKRPPEIDDDTQMRVTKFDVGEQYEDITQIVDEYFDSDFSFKGIGGGGATAFDFADTNNLMIGEQHILIAPQAEVSGNPSSITPDYVPFDVDMFDNHNHFAESFGGPSVDLRDNTATSAAGAPTHLMMMMMMMMNQHDQVSSLDSVFNTIPDTRTDLHHQNHSMNHIVSGQNTNDQYPIPAGPNILPEEFSMMRSVPKNYEGCLLSRQLGNGNITQQQQHHIVRQNTNQYQIPGPNILPPEEFSMVMSVPKNYEDCLLSRQLDNGKLTTLKKRRRL